MSLFIAFILAAVLLGAGAMLSPAWRTAQPRVALAATLCLALIVGGAVFYAEVFAWDTLVVDYLLFALLAGVVLGGTLSTAQARAEARGEALSDHDQGWPGPEDLAFFCLVSLLLLVPLLQMPLPLGTHGQALALHSLAARDGGSFTSLLPYADNSSILIAPSFHALSAYLSQQLGQPLPFIQQSIAAVLLLMLVWLAYDFGAELQNKRLGRAMALGLLLCGGALSSLLDGHYSELLALLFTLAFLLYALRLLHRFGLADLVAGGLLLGAVLYTSLDLFLAALVCLALLIGLAWQGRHGTERRARWGVTLGIPAIALLGTAPWLINNHSLLLPVAPATSLPGFSNLITMFRAQGFVVLPLLVWGVFIGWRAEGRLRLGSLLMLGWLLLLLDLAVFGVLPRLLPALGALVDSQSLARHAVILPLSWFVGLALLDLWEGRLPSPLRARLRRNAPRCLALCALGIGLFFLTFEPALNNLRALLDLPAATGTHDDIAAMDWLRENTPPDALLQATDGDGWLPVIAERRAIDFRAYSYFERALVQPAETATADYLLVPADADYKADTSLQLVFQQGEARVFQRGEA
ncbi:MAG: hypothetical protein OXH48_07540 [Chloroflexi bacterium]|nr:hypothetical protein [Chloroflexota bacterium]MCY3583879.1 hypothetical protein [Chloroflexota bacterium]